MKKSTKILVGTAAAILVVDWVYRTYDFGGGGGILRAFKEPPELRRGGLDGLRPQLKTI